MVAVASQPPVTVYSGSTPDNSFQPMNDCGAGSPLFYHMFVDDFDPYRSGDYSPITGGTGSSQGGVAGDGGLVLITGPSTAGQSGLQQPFASFTINQQPKKVFFEVRMAASVWVTAGVSFVTGLIQSTATPGVVTDGVWFNVSAAGVLSINSTVGGSTTTAIIPAAAYNLVNATSIDLAFNITRTGDVLAFVDTQLVGFIPQSNIGTLNNPQNAGFVSRLTSPSLTAVALNPTVALIQTATTVRTLTVDFLLAAKER